MATLNQCSFIGHLGKDPDLQVTSEGKPYTRFSLAVKGGKDQTMWLNVTTWEKLAETVERFAHKGTQVFVQGRLQLRPYKDKNGVERQAVDLVSLSIVAEGFLPDKWRHKEERLPMQQELYPSDWKLRAHACLAQAGYRCEDCGTPHGVLRVGKRSKSPYVVYLHAAHVNHDPDNPQTERKRIAAHKQGYHVVSTTRLVIEVRSAGLHITQEEDRTYWQIGELSGMANDVLDAIASALHCLRMERMEVRA
jgi:single stranded DNA-binding protein